MLIDLLINPNGLSISYVDKSNNPYSRYNYYFLKNNWIKDPMRDWINLLKSSD